MTLLDRFISYVKIDTMSSEEGTKTPSTLKQFDLARKLEKELHELGLTEIKLTDTCILTAYLRSNCNSDLTIGFLAHLDTIPDVSGTNVNPIIHKDYDGEPIYLKNDIVLSKEEFPFMENLIGNTLITTDGTTVLGADDKVGVALIMQMLEFFKTNPNYQRVNIRVAFTPDEEIGTGINSFDVKNFLVDYAYTVDGGAFNEINYENFNAAKATVTIKGLAIHPGSAKGKMKNANLIGMEYQSLLPVFDNPMYTEKYEGFNHLISFNGDVSNATLEYIIRNHDRQAIEKQKTDLESAVRFINAKYGINTASIQIKDTYYNMAEVIKKDMRSVDRAKEAIKKIGFEPVTTPIRGGTDGAKLSYKGILTPNLGTGGYNCHGEYEFVCYEEMNNVFEILLEIARG